MDKYLNELGSVEHRFGDRALDKRLDRLRKTAADFCHTEAYNGFVSREVRDYRNVGWPPIEVEGDPKKEALADKRSSKIHKEAEKFVEAHNGLVKAAKRRGYNLHALVSSAPRPPS